MTNIYQNRARRAGRRLTVLTCLACLGALSAGCASTPSTVQPWEKGNLAKPEMGFDSDPLRKGFMEHVYSSREAASGGSGVEGGGCGCN